MLLNTVGHSVIHFILIYVSNQSVAVIMNATVTSSIKLLSICALTYAHAEVRDFNDMDKLLFSSHCTLYGTETIHLI